MGARRSLGIAPGQKYHMLTVVAHVPMKPHSKWRVVCDCGNERLVQPADLGRSKSCGCMKLSLMRVAATTHGLTKTPTYRVWRSVMNRCFNKRAPGYRRYGAIGITVCERWKSFQNFLADMGDRPNGMYIDRIDNSKGYEPGNCRWATATQQQNNKNNNRRITMLGKTQTLAEWHDELGAVCEGTFHSRLRKGWSVWEALITPKVRPAPHEFRPKDGQ